MGENKRIFIAVNLPEKAMERIFETLSMEIPGKETKVVAKENLHVTMRFLGYLNDEGIEEICGKLEELRKFKKFEAEVAGAGEFGGRVIWIGIEKGNKELIEVARKIEELLGVEKDERFNPHITIARNKDLRIKEVRELVEKLNAKKLKEKIRVESIDVMQSILKREGPDYIVVKRIELG